MFSWICTLWPITKESWIPPYCIVVNIFAKKRQQFKVIIVTIFVGPTQG